MSDAWTAHVEACYVEHHRELWALFYACCSNPERATDAVQEAFCRLQEQEFAEIRDLRAWLLQVGRNWLRDLARRKQSAEQTSIPLEQTQQQARLEPDQAAVRAEQKQQVRHALDALREDDREILLLRYALDWSSQQIAAALEIRPPAVDMRLMRARQRLTTLLTEAGLTADLLDWL